MGTDPTNCRFLCIYSAVKMTAILCDYVLYNSQGQTQRRRKTVLTTGVTAAKTQAQAKWAGAEKMTAKEMFSWKGFGGIFEHHGDGKRKVEADHANVNTVHLSLLWIFFRVSVVSFCSRKTKQRWHRMSSLPPSSNTVFSPSHVHMHK